MTRCSDGRQITMRPVTTAPGCDDWFHDDDGSHCQHTRVARGDDGMTEPAMTEPDSDLGEPGEIRMALEAAEARITELEREVRRLREAQAAWAFELPARYVLKRVEAERDKLRREVERLRKGQE